MIPLLAVTVERPSREIPKGENLWLIGAFSEPHYFVTLKMPQ
jgi:hypothetical protein